MRDKRFEQKRIRDIRRSKGKRHEVRSKVSQLRGLSVAEALQATGSRPIQISPIQSRGDETMPFTVVPAQEEGMFVVQSEPMSKDEADKQAKIHNAMEGEEKGEEEKPMMPEFKKPGMPPFAEKPAAPAGKPPMGGGMPPMGM